MLQPARFLNVFQPPFCLTVSDVAGMTVSANVIMSARNLKLFSGYDRVWTVVTTGLLKNLDRKPSNAPDEELKSQKIGKTTPPPGDNFDISSSDSPPETPVSS